MTDFPRDDLVRMAGPISVRSGGDENPGNIMTGYPIVFNEPTEIDNWEGHFIERIAPGATTRTLKERAGRIQVLFNHGMDPQIGNKPLGRALVMKEDATGLYTETALSDTSYNADIRALLEDGAITGMSFRFAVVREDTNMSPKPSKDNPNAIPERTVTELKLYEFGPVTFPAYEAAAVGLRANWRELGPEERERIARILGIESLGTAQRHVEGNTASPPSGTSRDLLTRWHIATTIPKD